MQALQIGEGWAGSVRARGPLGREFESHDARVLPGKIEMLNLAESPRIASAANLSSTESRASSPAIT